MKIGFIGMGNLGAPIAANLLQRQHTLTVYNRTASKMQTLVEQGAKAAATVKEVAANCDIIFTMVSDDAALTSLTLGDDGIAANLKPGGIHISVSTILPATTTRLLQVHHEHQNNYIACPVLGRPEAAVKRQLNFLISGDATLSTQVKPLLTDAGGAMVWEFGPKPEAANVAKLCSNFLIVSAIEAMAEGINLANKSGIDASAWHHMITETLFAAPVYKNYGNTLLKADYKPGGFALRLGLKDVNLVLHQGYSTGAKMPGAELLKTQMEHCMQLGLGEHDWTAVALALK